MLFRRTAFFVVLVIACAMLPVRAAEVGSTEVTSYAAWIAEGKKAAAEQSWSHARDAYAAALRTAPDADSRRWCELWVRDAARRAEGEPRDWRQRETWIKRHQAAFDGLLKPYGDGLPHDDYWCAVMEARLAVKPSSDVRLAIADYLAGQVPTTVSATRYAEFLAAHPIQPARWPPKLDDDDRRWLEHLERGVKIAPAAEARARLALMAARFADGRRAIDLTEQARLWQNAVQVSAGTANESLVRAKQFLFQVRTGYAPDVASDTPAGIPARLAEARSLLAALAKAPKSKDIHDTSRIIGDLAANWERPHLELDVPGQLGSGQPLILRYGGEGYSELRCTVYRHTLTSWINRPADLRTFARAGIVSEEASRHEVENLRKSAAVPVATVSTLLAVTSDHRWQQGELLISSALAPGLYTVLIEAEGSDRMDAGLYHVQVTDVQATLVLTPSQPGTLLTSRIADGSPLAGAEIEGVIQWAQNAAPEPWRGRLDDEGRTRLPAISDPSTGFARGQIAAMIGGQPVCLDLYSDEENDQKPLIADLIFDRPLYRPGDTVHWKIILREWVADGFQVFRQNLYLSAATHETEEILVDHLRITPNAFGTAHGSFILPVDLRPGPVQLALSRTQDSDEDRQVTRLRGFWVDNFVPPAVSSQIELASASDSLRPGGEVAFRLRAQYLSGGPVVGSSVTCQVEATLGPGWGNDGRAQSPEVKAWTSRLAESPLAEVTDDTGVAEFRLRLPAELPDRSQLHLTTAITPEGGQAYKAEESWTIARTGVVVDPIDWTSARAVHPGEEVEFCCRVLDGRGMPTAFTGSAQIVEKVWAEAWLSPEGDIITGDALAAVRPEGSGWLRGWFPPPWKLLHAGYTSKTISEVVVRAGIDGMVRVRYTPPRDGVYQLELIKSGERISFSRGTTGELSLAVVAAGENTRELPVEPCVHLFAENCEIKEGQPVRLLAVLPSHFGTGVLLAQGRDDYRVQPVNATRSVQWLEVTDPPRFGGRASIILKFPNVMNLARSIRVRNPHQQIFLSIVPEIEEVTPGQTSVVRLHAPSPSKEKMRSEVVLAVADDSTYQLLGMNQGLTPSFLDPGSRSWPCYILNSDFVSAQGTKRNLADTRPGALLNPSRKQNVDFKELMRLSPFGGAVEAEYGYLRTNSALADRIGGPVGRGIGASLASGITIRRNFSLTAAWKPEVLTDENGNASVTVNYPDSLTRWRLDAYAVGADGNTFGQATAFTRTSLPFQARLQTPRCLTTGDTADLGALLLNRTDAAINATATLAVKGAAGLKTPDAAAHDHLSIGAQGEQRTAWTVQATEPGKTELTLTARTETHADGVALTLPVHADGFWQDTAASGRLTRESPEQTLTLALPTPFDPNCAKVTVRFSPGCSAAMLDALPYLVDYPYGCVEQTMSRFLPAVVVRETLAKLGFSADEVEQRIMHRESAADSTRRGGTAGLAKLDEVVAHSLARLVGAQHEDGGFGWWPGGEATDPWMTAYVVWGLALADQNGVRLPAKLEDKAREALNTWIARAEAVDDTLAWALAAVTRREINEKEREPLNKVFARVLTERAQLTAYGRACLALASERLGSADEQALLLRNLENGMQRSTAEGFGAAVHWGSATNYWRATDSAVECTALTLLALQALDPQHPLIEPATNWLVLNRRSARWTNSRDTAFAVLALARNPTALDAASDEAEVEVVVNGKPAGRVRSNRETLITNRLDLTLPAELLQAGDNQVSLRLIKEEGPLYALALASAWAENASAKPAGHLMSVGREFERRIAQPTLAGTVKLTSQSLRAGEAARAGEEVVALVTLTVPNELEYVVVEVPKPAGCEPLNPLSGWDARLRRIDDVPSAGEDEEDQGEPIYREEHDDRSAFFLRHLPAGTWQIRFGLRATTAGDYRAAPVKAEAMYALEVRANTEARRVCIEPRH